MADITTIDKNYAVANKVEREGLQYFDVENAPFRVYGVYHEDAKYRRMPASVAKSVSEGVYRLHTNTAGGRVRFVTDSPYVALHVEIDEHHVFPHMPLSGIAGLDLYAEEDGEDVYKGTFMPPYGFKNGYESVIDFPQAKERSITIHFPLYADVVRLYVGIKEGAALTAAPDYQYELPFVTYGSSITQGGCVSRPGNCYQNMLSRWLKADHLNLGFSGNAKAEEEMINWVKNLNMSAFVLDYDHNAPTLDHLENTHERFYKQVREAQPDLPIVIMPRPKHILNEEEKKRLAIIRRTYENAVNAGDHNVYFVDNLLLTKLAGNDGTVDNCHPNDLGFASIAHALRPVLEEILFT